METLIGIIIVIVILVFVIRLFGAWMLRINEVIKLLKEISKGLKSLKDFQQREY